MNVTVIVLSFVTVSTGIYLFVFKKCSETKEKTKGVSCENYTLDMSCKNRKLNFENKEEYNSGIECSNFNVKYYNNVCSKIYFQSENANNKSYLRTHNNISSMKSEILISSNEDIISHNIESVPKSIQPIVKKEFDCKENIKDVYRINSSYESNGKCFKLTENIIYMIETEKENYIKQNIKNENFLYKIFNNFVILKHINLEEIYDEIIKDINNLNSNDLFYIRNKLKRYLSMNKEYLKSMFRVNNKYLDLRLINKFNNEVKRKYHLNYEILNDFFSQLDILTLKITNESKNDISYNFIEKIYKDLPNSFDKHELLYNMMFRKIAFYELHKRIMLNIFVNELNKKCFKNLFGNN